MPLTRASCAITLSILATAAAAQAAGKQTIQVEPAAKMSWKQIVERARLTGRASSSPRVVPIMPAPPRRELGQLRRDQRPGSPSPAPGDGSRLAGRAPSKLITDSFPALEDNNTSIPPDTMGAAGPSHLVVMLNTQTRIQSKAGAEISTVSTNGFWTSSGDLVGSAFDPRIVFDSVDDRWIATVDANAESASSEVWFAISDTDDPTGDWTFYGFDADPDNTEWADFPGFGVSDKWIAITNNMFTVAANAFDGSKMWVIDKSTALAGGALTVTVFDTLFDFEGGFGTYGFALQPAITYDPAETRLFILDSTGFSSGGVALLRMSRIVGTPAAPTWEVVPGSLFAGTGLFFASSAFDFQVNASQLGTATLVDTGDPRLGSFTTHRNGHLWIAHSAGVPAAAVDRTNAYWYELDPAEMEATGDPIVQSGVIDAGAGTHHFYPSIAVNKDNAVCLAFSRSDSTRYVEAVATGRVAGDPLGTIGPIEVLKLGEDSYIKDFGSGNVRWGDYSATGIDPTDDSTFWTIQEYAEEDVGPGSSDDRWGTVWGKKSFAAPPAVPALGRAGALALALALLVGTALLLRGRQRSEQGR